MKKILDAGFKYTPSRKMGPGYLARRFAAIRAEQKATTEREKANAAEAAAKAVPLKRAMGAK